MNTSEAGHWLETSTGKTFEEHFWGWKDGKPPLKQGRSELMPQYSKFSKTEHVTEIISANSFAEVEREIADHYLDVEIHSITRDECED